MSASFSKRIARRQAPRAWCDVPTVCSRLNSMSAVFRLKRLKTHWLSPPCGVWQGLQMRRLSERYVPSHTSCRQSRKCCKLRSAPNIISTSAENYSEPSVSDSPPSPSNIRKSVAPSARMISSPHLRQPPHACTPSAWMMMTGSAHQSCSRSRSF